ncbi:stalk domain-containing protein [Cohnella sp. JJ-181]|uniref:stalk domain-containing protein n=1 Tax=Cohnella rhizoplanae TaxID=2974897 RepID=UPI0022FF8BB9|nr:stalk domain-containing protein [Cohnella sp. JJ-181]CAI6080688.1 hypothetical protein COHCIP112018_03067 [Cohnella sp. JJ-181]
MLLSLTMIGGFLFGLAPQRAAAVEPQTSVSETVYGDPDTVKVQLKDSGGNPLAGATVDYYDAGWKTFGTTDASGIASKALPDKSYTFHIAYEGTYVEKAQDTGADPLVSFQTVNVKVQLKDSQGAPLSGGVVSYYASGWKTFGTIADGEVSKELLPGTYTYNVDYEGTRTSKAQNTGADPVVVFQTVKAKVQLKDSQGNPLSGGTASYYGSAGWKTFGDVTGGEASKELLPGNYTFHVDYEGTRMDKAQQIGADPVIVFRTVKATVQLKNEQGYPLSGGAASYYATGWRTFGTTVGGTASKELLPGTYTFAMTYQGKVTEKVGDLTTNPIILFQAQAPILFPVAPKQSGQYNPLPIPPAERPRVLVNKDTLPALKARLSNPAFDGVWDSINTKAQRQLTGNFPARTGTAYTNIDPRTIEVMKSNALLYLIHGDEAAGQKAVSIAVNMANTTQLNPDPGVIFDVARQVGNLMFLESVVYDWCYDLMTEAQRAAIRQALGIWVRTGLEYPYPMKQNDKVILAGHANGEVHHQFKLAMGIALYETNPEYYNDIADYLLNVTMPGFNVMLDAEMPFEGPAYGDNRLKYIMMGNQLWKAIGIEPLTSKVGLALDRQVYTRRPDGFIMTEGDDFNTFYQAPWQRFVHGNITNMIAGSVYGNPRAQNEFLKQNTYQDELYYMLFFDPEAPAQSTYDTPLSKYFPAPYGSIVARTGWDDGPDSKSVVAVMNIGERTQTNHQHVDAGAFSMYYKGYLAIDSGIYNGEPFPNGTPDEYGQPHDLNYNKQSVAHNVVLIEDPLANAADQGRFSKSNQRSVTEIPRTVEQWNTDPGYQRGTILSHAIGDDEMYPDYSYLKGELTEAYGKTRTDNYTRSMAFLNFKDDEHPAAMIVYDNIDTPNANAKKRWLLHTINEPVREGSRFTNTVTERGYEGKMVTDALLPKADDLKVEKIGGPGREYEVDGVNYPRKPGSTTNIQSLEAGDWRIELSNEAPANQTRFLNVMQVMDAVDGPAPQDVHYSETDDYAGARIYDRVVFFAKDFDLIDQEATIAFDGEAGQTYKVLVTDLAEGDWTAVKEGSTASVKYKVVKDGNTLYFQGTPGTYTLQKTNASALPYADEVPSEPMERKIRVRIDGQGLDLDALPQLAGDSVMVPAEEVLEALGMDAAWNEAAQTVTATKDSMTIVVTAGSAAATVNGASVTMDEPAALEGGQLLIPVNFIGESLDHDVTWDSDARVANIVTLPPPEVLQWERVPLAPVTPIPIANLKEKMYASYTATIAPENVPKLFDNIQSNTSRWSGNIGTHIDFDFGETIQLERFDLAIYNGHTRSSRIMFSVSDDGVNWTNVYGGDTVGDTSDFMPFNFPSIDARYFRVAVFGSTDALLNPEWVSFSEMKFFVKK